jgi:hypothetical protein
MVDTLERDRVKEESVRTSYNSFIELKVRRISKPNFCENLINTRGVELSKYN